jgi:hypothetical protein
MHRRLVFLLSLALERSKNAKISSRSSEIVRYVGQSRYSPKKKKKKKRNGFLQGNHRTLLAQAYTWKNTKRKGKVRVREKSAVHQGL